MISLTLDENELESKELRRRQELLARQREILGGKTYFENRDIVFCPNCGELYELELPLDEAAHSVTCENCKKSFFLKTVLTKKYMMSVFEEGIFNGDESISEDNPDIDVEEKDPLGGDRLDAEKDEKVTREEV